MSDEVNQLKIETEAARAILQALKADELSTDAELQIDIIEGQTDLLEAIDAALHEVDIVEALIAGLKGKEEQFQRRRKLMEGRIMRLRATIEQAMALTDIATLRRPTATLTLRNLPPSVVITSEADIPADFFVPQPPPPPKLDLKALKAALLAQAEQPDRTLHPIPGAVLSNSSQSLQIRRL